MKCQCCVIIKKFLFAKTLHFHKRYNHEADADDDENADERVIEITQYILSSSQKYTYGLFNFVCCFFRSKQAQKRIDLV